MNTALKLAGLACAAFALIMGTKWALALPAIYAPPQDFKAVVSFRNGERILWIERFDILKLQRCDTGGDNGIFKVRYLRPDPIMWWTWERGAPTSNLYDRSGEPIRGTNRISADVGKLITITAGRWARFPINYDRFTHFSIEVPCQLADGRWVHAEWGPAEITRGEPK